MRLGPSASQLGVAADLVQLMRRVGNVLDKHEETMSKADPTALATLPNPTAPATLAVEASKAIAPPEPPAEPSTKPVETKPTKPEDAPAPAKPVATPARAAAPKVAAKPPPAAVAPSDSPSLSNPSSVVVNTSTHKKDYMKMATQHVLTLHLLPFHSLRSAYLIIKVRAHEGGKFAGCPNMLNMMDGSLDATWVIGILEVQGLGCGHGKFCLATGRLVSASSSYPHECANRGCSETSTWLLSVTSLRNATGC